MRLSTNIRGRIIFLSLLSVVALCPYAIPIPWLAITRWITGTVVENPGFLTGPVDNQTWFVIFGSLTTLFLAVAAGRWQWPSKENPGRLAYHLGICWFIYMIGRAVLTPDFQSMYHALLLQAAFLLLFVTAGALVISTGTLRRFQILLAVGAVPLAIIALMQNAGNDPLPYSATIQNSLDPVTGKNLIASTFGHPNYMGSYLAPIAILAVELLFSRMKWRWRVLGGLSAGVSVMALLAGGTRGPLLALIAGVVAFACLNSTVSRRRNWKIIGATTGALIIAAAGLFASGLTYKITDRLLASKEIASRAFYWVTGLEMFRHSPVFGIGLGQFNNQFWQTVSQMPDAQPDGPWYFVLHNIIRGVNPGYMHNDHLQTLVEGGVIGGILWVLFWAAIAFKGMLAREEYQATGSAGEAGLNAAFAGAFAAMWIDALFGFPFHLPCSGALFWVAVGLWIGWNRKSQLVPPGNEV